MSHKLSATLVLAMALSGCGGKGFDLVADPRYAQHGIKHTKGLKPAR